MRVISGDFDDVVTAEEGEKDFGQLLNEEVTKTRILRKVEGVISYVIDRPSVAGAVLQTASSFIN